MKLETMSLFDFGHITELKRRKYIGLVYCEQYGYIEYWYKGKLHRVDGPAVVWFNGNKEYYIEDKETTKENVEFYYHLMKLKNLI